MRVRPIAISAYREPRMMALRSGGSSSAVSTNGIRAP